MLEATLGTTALAKCLNDPKNATQIILENKEELLKMLSQGICKSRRHIALPQRSHGDGYGT